MSLPVTLRPEARDDLAAARDWYEQQNPRLGDRFADAVDDLLARIGAMPESYGVVFWDVRCGKVRKFPYIVYFRVLADRVEVIAILHGSRDSRAWKDRA